MTDKGKTKISPPVLKAIAAKITTPRNSNSSEDELTKPTPMTTTRKRADSNPEVGPSHDDREMAFAQLRKDNMLLQKQLAEKNKDIMELKEMVKELKEMIAAMMKSGKSSPGGTASAEAKKPVKVIANTQESSKKVSFAEILREENEKAAINAGVLRNRGVEIGKSRKHSPDGKFSSVDHKNEVSSIHISGIKDSKWIGNEFMYLVVLKDEEQIWMAAKDIHADTLIKEYHDAHTEAAKPDDYDSARSWQTVKRKEKNIRSKLGSKKQLTAQDIDFIAFNLVAAPTEPKQFKRVHYRITNKRALTHCSYSQKVNIMRKVIHSYGLSAAVIRLSFIGASVLEIYIQAETEKRFIKGMHSHGWEQIEGFDFYDMKSFDGKPLSEGQVKTSMEALIQRLAFLASSTQLRNLEHCILDGLKEETKESILKRKEEILEARAGERTAYVQKSQ